MNWNKIFNGFEITGLKGLNDDVKLQVTISNYKVHNKVLEDLMSGFIEEAGFQYFINLCYKYKGISVKTI